MAKRIKTIEQLEAAHEAAWTRYQHAAWDADFHRTARYLARKVAAQAAYDKAHGAMWAAEKAALAAQVSA